MKRFFAIILVIAIIIGVAVLIIKIKPVNDSRVTNDFAEKDIDGRYLTIINDTDQVINEIVVTVGNGTEIEEMKQSNPDERSFSIKIPEEYSEYNTFMVTLIDRYNMKYEKEVKEVKEKGRTEVIINKDNYVKEKGDFFKKINKFFNGD